MQKVFIAVTVVALFIPSLSLMQNRQLLKTPIQLETPNISVQINDNGYEIELDRISFYNPVFWQTDEDPSISSCGPNRENQIAVSRDLFFDDYGRKHLCGQKVTIITEDGEVFEDYVIWDTMNERFTKTADIMLPHEDHNVAMELGITSGVLHVHD